MNKVVKIIIGILGVIAMLAGLLIICIATMYVIDETKARNEKKEITENAINYFAKKYGANKNEISLSHTNLYGEHEKCVFSCWENQTDVSYGDQECLILYHIDKKYYSDDCQGDEIKTDLDKHLKNKYGFITEVESSADADGTPIKYNKNIDEYFNEINKFNADNKTTGNYGVITKIWVKANNNTQAKDIYQKKIKDLIIYLEKLGLDYSVNISRTNTDYEYYTFYHLRGYEEAFKVIDNVDKNNVEGNRSDYKDGSFVK